MPQHQHHCAACQYLGYEGPNTVEEKSYVDLYIHPGWRAGLGTFTRRWGPGPDEYAEIPIALADGPRWSTARAAAIKKGALKP
jgi:hypothetical protein